MNKAIEKAFGLWLSDGLLDETQVSALRASLEREQEGKSSPAITVIATFGSVLIGLGILLFVASNWPGMGALERVLAVFAAYLLSVLLASVTERRGLPRVASSLWLLTTLSVGAYMFLLGQLFNYSLTYWQAPFLWMIAALTMGYARNSKAHGMLAVPLALLALGWFGGGSGWFMDDQLEFLVSSGGLRPIFPLIGVGLVALAVIAGRARNESLNFLLSPCRAWAGLLISAPLVILSVDAELIMLFDIYWTTKQIVITVAVFALIGGVFAGGQRLASYIMLGFAVVMLLLLIPVGANETVLKQIRHDDVIHMFTIFTVFATAVAAAAFGARLNSAMMINFGVSSAAIIIFIQYFSWSFILLQRSLAFIVGGALLIVTAIFLERQRRKLIARISTSAEAA
jgi:uncharacterized membrane protein